MPTIPTSPPTLYPHSVDQLQDIIVRAHEDAIPLELIGHGSKREWGSPFPAEQVVVCSQLSGILLYEPSELILKARAGTPLSIIEDTLASHQQMLGFEPPDLGPLFRGDPGSSTLGGIISCNLSGPRRIAVGAARDHILGCEAISAQGEIFKAGGRVIKNVTGYDLPKLMTGAFGTLAALTSITLKVRPIPASVQTILIAGLDEQQAIQVMTIALQLPVEVSGASYLASDLARDSHIAAISALGEEKNNGVVALRLEGSLSSMPARKQYLVDEITSRMQLPPSTLSVIDDILSSKCWQEIRDVTSLAPAGQHG